MKGIISVDILEVSSANAIEGIRFQFVCDGVGVAEAEGVFIACDGAGGAIEIKASCEGDVSVMTAGVEELLISTEAEAVILCRVWGDSLIELDTCLLYTSPSPRD